MPRRSSPSPRLRGAELNGIDLDMLRFGSHLSAPEGIRLYDEVHRHLPISIGRLQSRPCGKWLRDLPSYQTCFGHVTPNFLLTLARMLDPYYVAVVIDFTE